MTARIEQLRQEKRQFPEVAAELLGLPVEQREQSRTNFDEDLKDAAASRDQVQVVLQLLAGSPVVIKFLRDNELMTEADVPRVFDVLKDMVIQFYALYKERALKEKTLKGRWTVEGSLTKILYFVTAHLDRKTAKGNGPVPKILGLKQDNAFQIIHKLNILFGIENKSQKQPFMWSRGEGEQLEHLGRLAALVDNQRLVTRIAVLKALGDLKVKPKPQDGETPRERPAIDIDYVRGERKAVLAAIERELCFTDEKIIQEIKNLAASGNRWAQCLLQSLQGQDARVVESEHTGLVKFLRELVAFYGPDALKGEDEVLLAKRMLSEIPAPTGKQDLLVSAKHRISRTDYHDRRRPHTINTSIWRLRAVRDGIEGLMQNAYILRKDFVTTGVIALEDFGQCHEALFPDDVTRKKFRDFLEKMAEERNTIPYDKDDINDFIFRLEYFLAYEIFLAKDDIEREKEKIDARFVEDKTLRENLRAVRGRIRLIKNLQTVNNKDDLAQFLGDLQFPFRALMWLLRYRRDGFKGLIPKNQIGIARLAA